MAPSPLPAIHLPVRYCCQLTAKFVRGVVIRPSHSVRIIGVMGLLSWLLLAKALGQWLLFSCSAVTLSHSHTGGLWMEREVY